MKGPESCVQSRESGCPRPVGMKSRWPLSILLTMLLSVAGLCGYNFWRGISRYREFPTEVARTVQPVLEAVYDYQQQNNRWPESLSDVASDDGLLNIPTDVNYVVADTSSAQLSIRGPLHTKMLYTFAADRNLRQSVWQFSDEGAGREIRCPREPWD